MNQVRGFRFRGECVQPFEKLRRVGVIAELLERGYLGAYWNHLTENLHLRRATFDCEASRAWRLKSNKNDSVLGIRQALNQVMLNASSGDHATG